MRIGSVVLQPFPAPFYRNRPQYDHLSRWNRATDNEWLPPGFAGNPDSEVAVVPSLIRPGETVQINQARRVHRIGLLHQACNPNPAFLLRKRTGRGRLPVLR